MYYNLNNYRTRYLNNHKHIPSGMYSSVEIRMFSQPASHQDATFLCRLQTYGLQGKKGRVFAFSTELCISTRCGFMQLGIVSDIHIYFTHRKSARIKNTLYGFHCDIEKYSLSSASFAGCMNEPYKAG